MPRAVRRLWVALVAVTLGLAMVVVAAPPASAATLKLRVYDATLVEGTGGQGLVAFAVRLSKPAPKKISFSWQTKSGTASASAGDFKRVRKGTRASIPKGATSTVLFVRVTADALDEFKETFRVHLSKASGGVKITKPNATATIRDDDPRPKLKVSTSTLIEGTSSLPVTRRITVTLSAPSGKHISARYTLIGGSAALGTDLGGGSAVLNFKRGQTTKKIKLDVFADAKDEPNETFTIAWSKPSHVKLPSHPTSMTLLDDDGPLQPQILSSDPVSPSPVLNPKLIGIAPAESTVEFFANGSCAGAPIASGGAATFGGTGVTVPMTANTTNVVSVRATNTVGGADTACSDPFTYVHDDIAPAAPDALASVPTSPTQDPSPKVTGHAEAGSQVKVFVDTNCSATPIGTFTPAELADGVSVGPLTPDVPHTIRFNATDAAGNVSSCSELPLVIDTIGPDKPTGLGIVGGSPTTDSAPLVRGTAEAGSQVQVWVGANCAGVADAAGSAATFAGPGISGLPNLADGQHQVVARATDGAGNVGDCSDPFAFEVDTTAPDAPMIDPIPDGPDQDPLAKGTAEPGSTVTVYLSSNCTGPAVGSVTAGVFSGAGIALGPLTPETYSVSAEAEDAAGNVSDCSAPETFTVG